MVSGLKAREFLWIILPTWYCCLVDATCLSGVLLFAWNLARIRLNPFRICGGILLKCFCRVLDIPLHIINYCGIYVDQLDFWEAIERCGLVIGFSSLILAGDLKFTTTT